MNKIKNIFTSLLLILFCQLFTNCESEQDGEATENNLQEKNIPLDKYYEHDIFNEENSALYGKWKLVDITGGFTGNGYENNFDFLEIQEIGIYKMIRNDSVLSFGKIIIDEQNDEVLKISPEPNRKLSVLDKNETCLAYHFYELKSSDKGP